MTSNDIIGYVANLTPLILLFGVILGLIRFKNLSPVFRLIFYYLILAISFNILSKVFALVFQNNLVLVPLYGVFELTFFMILYGFILCTGKLAKAIVVIGSSGIVVSLIECFSLDYSDPSKFQPYSRAMVAFLIVLFCMFYFFDKLSKGTATNDVILKLNTIVLAFFSLNLIFFLPINFLVSQSSDLRLYFISGNILIASLFYAFLTHMIWKNGKTRIP